MILIWTLSSRPGDSISIPGGFDKLAHFVEYAVLGFLLGKGLGRPLWWAALLAAVAWGGIDEWHQSWVPLRDSSALDVAADGLGALIGVAGAIISDNWVSSSITEMKQE